MRSHFFRFLAISVLMALTLSLFGVASAHAADPATTFSGYKDYVQFKTSDATPSVLREGRLVVTTSGGNAKHFRDVDGVVRKVTFSTSSGGTANDTLNVNFAVGVISVNVPGCDFATTECFATTTSGTWTATGGLLAKLGLTTGTYSASAADPTRHNVTAFNATFTSGEGIISGLRDIVVDNSGTCKSHILVDPFGTIVADLDGGSVDTSYFCTQFKNKKGNIIIVQHPVSGTFDTTNGLNGALRADDGKHFALFTKTAASTSYSGGIIRASDVTNPSIGTWTATIS